MFVGFGRFGAFSGVGFEVVLFVAVRGLMGVVLGVRVIGLDSWFLDSCVGMV